MNDTPQCLMYLIRHGATVNNVAKPPRLQGRTQNPGLSPEGRIQAQQTAKLLANRPLAAVYASPMLRAQETAQIIAEPHGLPVQTESDIIEVDVGLWEGRSWVDIAREEPEAYQRFIEDAGEHGYSGGETFRQVQERVTPAIEQLMRENLGRQIAVVGHNVVNRTLIAGLLGIPVGQARELVQHNCGVNVLRLRDDQLELRTYNSGLHLE